MHNVEIEFRYLASRLPENALKLFTGDKVADERINYANFTIDDEVRMRAQKSPLRVRLYQATPSDIGQILGVEPLNRLDLLRVLAKNTRRELEFTLKVPTEQGSGRGELESLRAIGNHLNLGPDQDSPKKLAAALRASRLAICASVYTERSQWNLGRLTEHSSLIITRDSSRCHHQLDGQAREIIEVEALVSMKGNPKQSKVVAATEEAERALKQWVKTKLGFVPDSVIGTATACIIAHNVSWAREMLNKKAVKPAVLQQMVDCSELSDVQRLVILA